MAFNFGSMVAGFAEREMEVADRERKSALDLAKSTLNYRAELAMENRKKRDKRINNDVRLGRNLMSNFGFSKAQVGALIQQGELESVYTKLQEYQQDAKNKGKPMPSPNTIVKLASDKPIDMDFDDYVNSLYMAPAAAPEAMKVYGEQKQKSGFLGGIFDRDSGRDAREYSQQFAEQMGMPLDEMTNLAFQGDPRADAGFMPGDVTLDMSPLATGTDVNYRTTMSAVEKGVQKQMAPLMGLGDVFSTATGDYIGTGVDRAKDNFLRATAAGSAIKVAQLMKEGVPYEDAYAQVRRMIQDSDMANELAMLSGYRGDKIGYGYSDIPVDAPAVGYNFTDTQRGIIQGAQSTQELGDLLATLPEEVYDTLEPQLIGKTLDQQKDILLGSVASTQTPAPDSSGGDGAETVTPPDAETQKLIDDIVAAGIDPTDYGQVKETLKPIVDAMREAAIASGEMSNVEAQRVFNLDNITNQAFKYTRKMPVPDGARKFKVEPVDDLHGIGA